MKWVEMLLIVLSLDKNIIFRSYKEVLVPIWWSVYLKMPRDTKNSVSSRKLTVPFIWDVIRNKLLNHRFGNFHFLSSFTPFLHFFHIINVSTIYLIFFICHSLYILNIVHKYWPIIILTLEDLGRVSSPVSWKNVILFSNTFLDLLNYSRAKSFL